MRSFFFLMGVFILTLPCHAKPLTMAQTRVAFRDPVEMIDAIPGLEAAFKKILTPEDFGLLYSIRGPQDGETVQHLNGEEVFFINMSMAHFAVLQFDLGFAVPNRFWISIHGPQIHGSGEGEIASYYSTVPAWQEKIPFEWDEEAKKHPLSKKQLDQFAAEFTLDSSMVKFSKESCELKGLVFNDLYAAQVKNGGKKLFFKPCSKPCSMVDHKRYVVEGDEVQLFGPEMNGHRCAVYASRSGSVTMDWLPLSGLAVQPKALPLGVPEVGTWKSYRVNSEISVTQGKGEKSRGLIFKKGESISLSKEFNSTEPFTFDASGEANYAVRTEENELSKVRLISKNPFLIVVPDAGFPMLYARSLEKAK